MMPKTGRQPQTTKLRRQTKIKFSVIAAMAGRTLLDECDRLADEELRRLGLDPATYNSLADKQAAGE